MLVGILAWREAWRIRLPPDEHRRLRPLAYAAAPFLVGFVVVVVERFVLLTS